jgi:serine/threonine protein kinase
MENLIFNGRYRILQQIGVGGFGLTYLAEDLQLPTRPKSVVKHLRPQISDEQTMTLANRLFQQEAEILYRLGGHPNIPSLIAHFKERGEFFLVQEFIEGHTIDREFTGGRRYNQKEIVQFLGQTLEILSFVHSQNVIHRDVKPSNLIRRASDGNIFLIDFGAVKQVGAASPQTTNGATFSTITIGSHGYMPMEQMAGNPNFSSDIYALGLVAIEALTGIKPLELPKHATTNEFLWSHKAQLSPGLERFIAKLVRMDFRQRYASATEALAALNSIAAGIGFFCARPAMPVMMTVQPVTGSQNFQPAALPPVADSPQFIPPTIIVPAGQNFPVQSAPRAFQNTAPAQPKKSSTPAVVLTIAGIFFFLGFLFVAGKVLNFRWSSLRASDEFEREDSRPTQIRSTNFQPSLYGEAMKQAQEAADIEKNATTRFEWEQIGNKYKRAAALLASIDSKSPEYDTAQPKIGEYREKSEQAYKKMQSFMN